jgi:hypothetical protein
MYKLQLVDELCRRVASYAQESSPTPAPDLAEQSYVQGLNSALDIAGEASKKDKSGSHASLTANLPRQVSAIKKRLSVSSNSKMSYTESAKKVSRPASAVSRLMSFNSLSNNLSSSRAATLKKDDTAHKRFDRIFGLGRNTRDESTKKLIPPESSQISKSNKVEKPDQEEKVEEHYIDMSDRITEMKKWILSLASHGPGFFNLHHDPEQHHHHVSKKDGKTCCANKGNSRKPSAASSRPGSSVPKQKQQRKSRHQHHRQSHHQQNYRHHQGHHHTRG